MYVVFESFNAKIADKITGTTYAAAQSTLPTPDQTYHCAEEPDTSNAAPQGSYRTYEYGSTELDTVANIRSCDYTPCVLHAAMAKTAFSDASGCRI